MMTNAPLSRTLARWGSLLRDPGPIYVVSFYLITIHNSLIFIEAPSLEGLPTKAKEDPTPREMRLSLTGHQLSISWSWEIIIIIIMIIIIVIIMIIIIIINIIMCFKVV